VYQTLKIANCSDSPLYIGLLWRSLGDLVGDSTPIDVVQGDGDFPKIWSLLGRKDVLKVEGYLLKSSGHASLYGPGDWSLPYGLWTKLSCPLLPLGPQ